MRTTIKSLGEKIRIMLDDLRGGGDGFDGSDETYEPLLQIDETYTTLADVAVSINHLAQLRHDSL